MDGVEHATVSLRLPAGSDVGRSPTGRVVGGHLRRLRVHGARGAARARGGLHAHRVAEVGGREHLRRSRRRARCAPRGHRAVDGWPERGTDVQGTGQHLDRGRLVGAIDRRGAEQRACGRFVPHLPGERRRRPHRRVPPQCGLWRRRQRHDHAFEPGGERAAVHGRMRRDDHEHVRDADPPRGHARGHHAARRRVPGAVEPAGRALRAHPEIRDREHGLRRGGRGRRRSTAP
jgi:hypothetical protein